MTVRKKHYRIKSRVRFTIFTVITLLLLTAAANFILGFSQAAALERARYRTVYVAYGDTLWDIAAKYMPQDMDIRESVYLICIANDTSADTVYPGQKLKIPTDIEK